MLEIPSKVPLLASPPFPPLSRVRLAHHDGDFDVDVDDEEYVANREILDKFVQ